MSDVRPWVKKFIPTTNVVEQSALAPIMLNVFEQEVLDLLLCLANIGDWIGCSAV